MSRRPQKRGEIRRRWLFFFPFSLPCRNSFPLVVSNVWISKNIRSSSRGSFSFSSSSALLWNAVHIDSFSLFQSVDVVFFLFALFAYVAAGSDIWVPLLLLLLRSCGLLSNCNKCWDCLAATVWQLAKEAAVTGRRCNHHPLDLRNNKKLCCQ